MNLHYNTYLDFSKTTKSVKKPTLTNVRLANKNKHRFFSYIVREKCVHSKIKHGFNPNTFFIRCTNWFISNELTTNHFKPIDPIAFYYVSLFVFSSKFQKVNNSFWDKYIFIANLIQINLQKSHTLGVNNLSTTHKSRYFYQTHVNAIRTSTQINGLNNNLYSMFNFVSSKNSSKKFGNKFKQSKLIANDFRKAVKQSQTKGETIATYRELKRLFKANYFKKLVIEPNFFKYALPRVIFKLIKPKVKVTSRFNIKKKGFKKTNIKKQSLYKNDTTEYTKSFFYKLSPTNYDEGFIYGSTSNQIKNRLSLITNSNFVFYKINALSLTRFTFERDRLVDIQKNRIRIKKKTTAHFLKQLQQKRESRYRYVANYVKDLVRITFFCLFLKKASFLANFYAFRLTKLPRKRKETKLIHFLAKTLKIFSTQRPEIIGVRLRVQGRLNRWRRTKHINGQKGHLNFYSYNSRIEFGIAQAITRKGTQGIRIWLCYNSNFKIVLKKAIFSYIILDSTKNKKITHHVST